MATLEYKRKPEEEAYITTSKEEYPKTPWQIAYEEARAFCKENNVESYEVSRCKFCNVLMLYSELKQHRLDVHDAPRGITHHTEYYCGVVHHQSQIVLIEPYGLSAEPQKPNTGGLGTREIINEPHIHISANDQDVERPSRSIDLYLTKDRANDLLRQLKDAITKLETHGDYYGKPFDK